MFPATAGRIVNVCEADEFEKERTFAANPVLPVPEGVIVIVPEYALFGVTVKLPEALFRLPEEGPMKKKPVAAAFGRTEFEAEEEVELPAELIALTVKV